MLLKLHNAEIDASGSKEPLICVADPGDRMSAFRFVELLRKRSHKEFSPGGISRYYIDAHR